MFTDTGVTVMCVHPGTPVKSSLTRELPLLNGNMLGILPYFYFTLARESSDGAQALLLAALDPCAPDTYHGAYME